MRKQQPSRPHHRHFAASTVFTAIATIAHLLAGHAFARLSPDDLAAISRVGLIPLTGEQEGEYSCKEYVVVETMNINRGQTVSFAAGSRLFFHEDAKIIINGTLTCEGTSAKPVTIGKLPFKLPKFSSLQPARQFDTTTISINGGGAISLLHTRLADPTVRIGLTDITGTFTFDSVSTAGNWFSLPDTTNFFPPDAVLTCSNADDRLFQPCRPILPKINNPAETKPEQRRGAVSPMVPLRITIGAVVAGAAGAWYVYNDRAAVAIDKWETENRNSAPDPSTIKTLRLENKKAALYRDIASAVGGCGLAGLTVTFFIGGSHR